MSMDPFRNNTFRCPRCGSHAGPACRCWEAKLQKQELVPIPSPQLKIIQVPVVMIELIKPPKKL